MSTPNTKIYTLWWAEAKSDTFRDTEEQILSFDYFKAGHESALAATQPAAAPEAPSKRELEMEAARIAYASEFPLNADGEPDVGNIHANIRALKADLRAALAARKPAAPSEPTDLSKRLREWGTSRALAQHYADAMVAAADEIERYYGMLAWKQTAEKKDATPPAAPYAYTYVHIDGKRMWRMAASRLERPESGWTETALLEVPSIPAQADDDVRMKLMPSRLPDLTAIDAAAEINRKGCEDEVSAGMVKRCYDTASFVYQKHHSGTSIPAQAGVPDEVTLTAEDITKVRGAKRRMVDALISSGMQYKKCGGISYHLERLIDSLAATPSTQPADGGEDA